MEKTAQALKISVNALANVYTYPQYRSMIEDLLKNNQTTGNDQSEGYVDYTRQNVHRMNRMEQWVKIPEDLSILITRPYQWLVLSEAWCGDASQNVPVMAALAKALPNIDLKIVLRDEHPALMAHFLTNGGKAIPKLIVIDPATQQVLAHWGPRPQEAQNLVMEMKKNPNVDHHALATEVFKWYAKDKGVSTVAELVDVMQSLEHSRD
jgi:hypothetical protein